MKRDPVTPAMRLAVLERDRECVAVKMGEDPASCRSPLTLDHVQSDYGRMGRRAPSDMEHLVTICRWHHLDSSWATSNRPSLRAYLAVVNAKETP